MGREDPWRTGTPDLFHRYQDTRLRRARGLGNGAQFCFDLDGDVDADDLRARLDRLLETAPVLGAGVAPWPGTGWRPVPGHRIEVQEERLDGPVTLWFSRWFGQPYPTPQEPSLQVVLGRHEGGTAVLLRFLHILTDAPGIDLLCQLLDGADPARFLMRDSQGLVAKRAAGGRPAWRRALDTHNFALRHLLRSLWPVARPPGDRATGQCVLSHSFSREETAAIDARAVELAGALDRSSFFVGLAARAAVRAWKPAGWRALRIPIPVSLRPPAWRGPVLSNFFTMVLLWLPVRRLGTLKQAVGGARRGWHLAFGRGEDAANFLLLSPARWLPYPLMRLFLDGPALRDSSTLHYSYFELKTGRDGTFLGLPLRGFLTASSVLSPPGAALLAARCAGRLTLGVPGQGGPANEALLREAVALATGEVE